MRHRQQPANLPLWINTGVGTGDTVLSTVPAAASDWSQGTWRSRGARVNATACPGRHDQLREYGAEPVVCGDGAGRPSTGWVRRALDAHRNPRTGLARGEVILVL